MNELKAPVLIIDEAVYLDDETLKKLDKLIVRSRYIGKPGLLGRLKYHWYKLRGRTNGNIWWTP